MKQFYFYLVCLLLAASAAQAAGFDPVPGPTREAQKGGVKFQFDKIAACQDHKDSVLIIFDRFNRTGAGVIYQVFAADQDHSITISGVPAGKYYVTIQCLGSHHDRLEKLVRIKAKKSSNVKIQLEDSEVVTTDKVVIPSYRPDFANLTILRSK
jgi:hypothetical protein